MKKMSKRIFVMPVEGREEIIDNVGCGHPIDGVLREHGSFWTYDSYTCQMLMDGVIRDTGEVDTGLQPRSPGPEAIMQHRRVARSRPRMRIHNPPTGAR
jgi:hypothetical protein